MLSVDEALKLVLSYCRPLPMRLVQPCDALGQVLAEPVVSDIDSPPHDKSIVDGYAVIAADILRAEVDLTILEEVTAGAVPTRAVEPGTATRIMTGAPLPRGADAVVMVEQTRLVRQDRVQIVPPVVKAGQNIMRRAASLIRGETVLQPGKIVRAIELGLLAEVGYVQVPIIGRPNVAVLATGNELVDHSEKPGAGQIRNSNGPMLRALVEQTRADGYQLISARDTELELTERIGIGLAHDVLLITGGVSAGVLDLVPKVLTNLGVEQVFHKVNLKPGKPLWFGVKRHTRDARQTLVFGLPGNPVSTLVCFELFVRPALEQLSGREPMGLPCTTAVLTHNHQQRGDRPTYWPAKLAIVGAESSITPLPWKGSGDLRTLAEAHGLACFPAGDRLFEAGESILALRFANCLSFETAQTSRAC